MRYNEGAEKVAAGGAILTINARPGRSLDVREHFLSKALNWILDFGDYDPNDNVFGPRHEIRLDDTKAIGKYVRKIIMKNGPDVSFKIDDSMKASGWPCYAADQARKAHEDALIDWELRSWKGCNPEEEASRVKTYVNVGAIRVVGDEIYLDPVNQMAVVPKRSRFSERIGNATSGIEYDSGANRENSVRLHCANPAEIRSQIRAVLKHNPGVGLDINSSAGQIVAREVREVYEIFFEKKRRKGMIF